MLFQESTLDVRSRYAEYGFAAVEYGHFPEDHVSMMLDFLAHLSTRAFDAFESEEDDETRQMCIRDRLSTFGCAPQAKVEENKEHALPTNLEEGGTWVPAACWHNCGGRCVNKVMVKEGVVVRQKTCLLYTSRCV